MRGLDEGRLENQELGGVRFNLPARDLRDQARSQHPMIKLLSWRLQALAPKRLPSNREKAPLPPIADAAIAGPAWPCLDTAIHCLCVQRIAATMCKPDPGRAARLVLWTDDPGGYVRSDSLNCYPRLGDVDARRRDPARIASQVRPRSVRPCSNPGAIGIGFHWNRLEARRRAKRPWRQHRLGEVEAEIFAGLVLCSTRRHRDRQHGTRCNCNHVPQDHRFLLNTRTPHTRPTCEIAYRRHPAAPKPCRTRSVMPCYFVRCCLFGRGFPTSHADQPSCLTPYNAWQRPPGSSRAGSPYFQT